MGFSILQVALRVAVIVNVIVIINVSAHRAANANRFINFFQLRQHNIKRMKAHDAPSFVIYPIPITF